LIRAFLHGIDANSSWQCLEICTLKIRFGVLSLSLSLPPSLPPSAHRNTMNTFLSPTLCSVSNIYRLRRHHAKCLREISREGALHITQEGFKCRGGTYETSRRIECTKQVGSTRSIFVLVSSLPSLACLLCLLEWWRRRGFRLFASRLFKW